MVLSGKKIVEIFSITIEGTREELDSLAETMECSEERDEFTTAIYKEIKAILSKRERSK